MAELTSIVQQILSGGCGTKKCRGGKMPAGEAQRATAAYKQKLEDQLYDPQYDALLQRKDQMASSGVPRDNSWYMKKSEPEKARWQRQTRARYDEYKQGEDDRLNQEIYEMEKPKSNGILDGIGNVFSALDPTGLSSMAYDGLRGALEGSGKNRFVIHAVEVSKQVPFERALKEFHNIIRNNKKKFYKSTLNYYKFRNIPKTKFKVGSFKSHRVNDDIRLIMGELK